MQKNEDSSSLLAQKAAEQPKKGKQPPRVF
jgi:hypothetical protein